MRTCLHILSLHLSKTIRWIVCVLLVVLPDGAGLKAQILDFSEEPAPPALGESNYADARAAELNDELTRLLVVPQSDDARADLVLRARINVLRIAIDLLHRLTEPSSQ